MGWTRLPPSPIGHQGHETTFPLGVCPMHPVQALLQSGAGSLNYFYKGLRRGAASSPCPRGQSSDRGPTHPPRNTALTVTGTKGQAPGQPPPWAPASSWHVGFHNLQRGRAGEGRLPRGPHSSDTGILPEKQQRGSFARFPRVCTHITSLYFKFLVRFLRQVLP